jgi:TolB-like protein
MGELLSGLPSQRLDSWKSIAEYLSRDVRTVIRWEKERGLPVHRVPGGRKHSVFAFKRALDAWMLNTDTERVLAVLPFSNDSGEEDLDPLADGLTESLISLLSQIPTLRVLARSTVFRYRIPDLDPLAAARELKAQIALTGILRKHADQLQISLEMLDPYDGSQICGFQRMHSLDETWGHEGDIAEQIASALHAHLAVEQQAH